MNFFKRLQAKPYEQRVRILKIASIIAGIIIIAIWAGTMKLRDRNEGKGANFQKLENSWEELKAAF